MLKKIFYNKQGFTLVELMIVVAVTVIITTISVVYIKGDVNDDVDLTATQLLSDIRWARNASISRVAYDFGDGNGSVYPPGGYGISFTEGGSAYTIFADKDTDPGYDLGVDGVIKSATLVSPLKIIDANNSTTGGEKYFVFKIEDEVSSNFTTSTGAYAGKYVMAVNSGTVAGTKGTLVLGETASDGRVFVSLGLGFEGYNPPGCLLVTANCYAGGTACCTGLSCTSGKCALPVVGGGDTSCFPAGTKISMADNTYKNIEDVEIGDYVLSYDEVLGKEVSAEVLKLVTPIRQHMCELKFTDSTIQLTDEHPIYTMDGWKAIDPEKTLAEDYNLFVNRLMLGDEVFFKDGIYNEVLGINCWKEEVQTYNLKDVAGYNTFFAEDVLVHNLSSAPDCGITDPITKPPVKGYQ